ncbi:MAG: ABC transporter permease [Bacillota bacterium]
MGGYLARRLLSGALAILGIVIVVFVLVRMLGDPAALMMPPEATKEEIEIFRHAYGFDRPIHVQLVDFMRDLARGDLGRSLRHDEPVMDMIMERLPATLKLSVTALVVSLILAVPLGVIAAIHRGTFWDRATMVMAMLGQSVPDFWLGLMLIYLAGVRLRLAPISGYGGFSHLILPALTLSAFPLARTTRIVRSAMLEVLGQDYIRTARSKGLSERMVTYKHALKNALIPVITVVGLDLGALLGGAVIVETIFAWPGMGRLVVQALDNRDFPLVQGGVLVMAISYVGVNILVDLLYSIVDPRIRCN